MKIISWNVNGLRAWAQKENTIEYIEKKNPDIFCLQETKAQKEQIEEFFQKENKDRSIKDGEIFSKWPHYFLNSAEKKGYSGTAIFSKIKPISESYGLPNLKEKDKEGRVITLEFEDFFLINVYTPNSKHGLLRVDYRYNSWDKAFLKHMQKLEKKKPVVVCGDLNVAHNEIDLANPKSNMTTKTKIGNPGFSDKEREGFENFISAGFIDTFRLLHPKTIKYSWWSYRSGSREKNVGWRIDYFLTSKSLKDKISKAEIDDLALGSDHCPVSLDLKKIK